MNLLKIIQNQLDFIPKNEAIIIALSGGVDSVVLTHLLKNLGYNLIFAHFNHGWRGKESDEDQAFVQKLAQDWGFALEIAKSKKASRGNAENRARKERYLFLEAVRQKYNAQWIAVGHHRDDQIETILMHQTRGAGLRGLRGMTFVQGHVIRPLLSVTKADLMDYAQAHHLEWREDKSNQDVHYTRNRLRYIEIPQLKAKDPVFEEKLLQKSSDAHQKLEKLQKKVQKWIKAHLKNHSFDSEIFSQLTQDLQSEILIQLLGSTDLYRSTITRLMNWIKTGRSGTKMLIKGQTFWREHEKIYIEPNRRNYGISPARLAVTELGIQWGHWFIQNQTGEKLFVRPWRPGDRFSPFGLKGSKKVQDFFVDAKIPLHERGGIPLILNEKNDIISIASYRFSQVGQALKSKLHIIKNEKL